MPFCSQENNLDFMNVHHLKSGFVGIDPFLYYIYIMETTNHGEPLNTKGGLHQPTTA
jgi:hypothetical protein